MRSMRLFAALCLCALSACATLSPASRIKSDLVGLGVPEPRAECLAKGLDERLNRSDLNDVANFLEKLNRAKSTEDTINALLRIENPRAAAAIASAGITCALNS